MKNDEVVIGSTVYLMYVNRCIRGVVKACVSHDADKRVSPRFAKVYSVECDGRLLEQPASALFTSEEECVLRYEVHRTRVQYREHMRMVAGEAAEYAKTYEGPKDRKSRRDAREDLLLEVRRFREAAAANATAISALAMFTNRKSKEPNDVVYVVTHGTTVVTVTTDQAFAEQAAVESAAEEWDTDDYPKTFQEVLLIHNSKFSAEPEKLVRINKAQVHHG